jgi:hypothetical protein
MPRVRRLWKPSVQLELICKKRLKISRAPSFGVSLGTPVELCKQALDLNLICNIVLDPVMGDQGRLYVNDDVVPAYKKTIHHADLILPNQFEAE